jgi:hypothetical protein
MSKAGSFLNCSNSVAPSSFAETQLALLLLDVLHAPLLRSVPEHSTNTLTTALLSSPPNSYHNCVTPSWKNAWYCMPWSYDLAEKNMTGILIHVPALTPALPKRIKQDQALPETTMARKVACRMTATMQHSMTISHSKVAAMADGVTC